MGLRCLHTSIFIETLSLEGLPTKAKEDPSSHEMRLSPAGHQPSISWSRGNYYYYYHYLYYYYYYYYFDAVPLPMIAGFWEIIYLTEISIDLKHKLKAKGIFCNNNCHFNFAWKINFETTSSEFETGKLQSFFSNSLFISTTIDDQWNLERISTFTGRNEGRNPQSILLTSFDQYSLYELLRTFVPLHESTFCSS